MSCANCLAPWLGVPLNIRCSRKWAMPVAPRSSLREPTRYHTWKDTIGLRGSSSSSTRSPLSSVAVTTRFSPRAPDGTSSATINRRGIAMRIARLYRPPLKRAGVSSCVMRVLVFLLLLAIPQPAFAQQACTESLASLYERVSPSVVSIQVTKINKAKPQRRFETVVGSGVVIERDGHVLTNAHVVDGAASLSITLDSGTRTPARVLGMDTVTDLALLRIETPSPLPAARLGDSSALHVGDEVVAIGNPMGLEQTMTRGIVSGLNRILPGLAEQPMIQTDAPINPGNSG